ncbi:type IV pilus modification PilV family protein [Marinobacter gelidimuriae]|uniref:type IV pilus modification PilV family protein n=1 Tax=Marinobacter gelidimuriae TaxID=2739064 RepID=UPI000374F077|nr:type II secretion system protein [Marinobacter gelidimuriae]
MVRNHTHCPRQKGTTLIELVMTIVIISVAIAGVVGAFSLIVGRSADPLNQVRAVALAQLYYDELVSVYYDLETPLGGGVVNVDVVICDDLHRQPSIENPYKSQGFVAGYEIVDCAGNDAAFKDLELEPKDVKQIRITITDPTGQKYLFSAYRGNF